MGAGVGLVLAVLRDEKAVSQDRLAAAARSVGLGWTRASVASREAGRRALSAGELLALPVLVQAAFGERLGLEDLLRGATEEAARAAGDDRPAALQLTEELVVSSAYLKDLVEGDWLDAGIEAPWKEARDERQRDFWEKVSELRRELWPDAPPAAVAAALEASVGEAERKAAAKLATTPEAVALASVKLFGVGLTEHRDVLVAAEAQDNQRTTQAKRGHVTRALVAEVAAYLREQGVI